MICNCLPNKTIPQTDQCLEATAKDHPQTHLLIPIMVHYTCLERFTRDSPDMASAYL